MQKTKLVSETHMLSTVPFQFFFYYKLVPLTFHFFFQSTDSQNYETTLATHIVGESSSFSNHKTLGGFITF